MSRILIKNALVIVTMDDEEREIPGGDLLISGETIEAVGSDIEATAETVIDASG
ncbi:MAG: 8-oxoguanine deaminase, partial [Deltaproteobacteria bacterium]